MVRLRRAGGVTSRRMFLSLPMGTASPARGALPPGQDAGADQRVCATPEDGAWAAAGIFMPACASWVSAKAGHASAVAAPMIHFAQDRIRVLPMLPASLQGCSGTDVSHDERRRQGSARADAWVNVDLFSQAPRSTPRALAGRAILRHAGAH